MDVEARADEVDRIVAAWRRERPDLDVEPLTVFSRVSRLARHLDRARRGAFARHDLETWEFDVLSALRRAGEPYRLSPGVLVAQTLVTSGTMTNRIDRLEERGLVERHRCPDDRRGVLVRAHRRRPAAGRRRHERPARRRGHACSTRCPPPCGPSSRRCCAPSSPSSTSDRPPHRDDRVILL